MPAAFLASRAPRSGVNFRHRTTIVEAIALLHPLLLRAHAAGSAKLCRERLPEYQEIVGLGIRSLGINYIVDAG